MILTRFSSSLPSLQSLGLAILSAILLILAFPDFEYWFLAWLGFIPLLLAVDRQKVSAISSFFTGWLFGTCFFLGTCWWLTYSMIRYGGLPAAFAYLLLLIICLLVGLFPAMFAAITGVLMKRFGRIAVLAAPFAWEFTELMRHYIVGTSWNAVAYTQAFGGWGLSLSSVGGIYLTGFSILTFQTAAVALYLNRERIFGTNAVKLSESGQSEPAHLYAFIGVFGIAVAFLLFLFGTNLTTSAREQPAVVASVVTIQPNVPMSGLDYEKWMDLRGRHVALAEKALGDLAAKMPEALSKPVTVVFPESPMNFMYADDREFQSFVHDFASKHNVDLLFNSAEPNPLDGKYFNSAVLTDTTGREIAQYDKIHLVPFGEAVPAPFENIIPALVGSFSYGTKYEVMPFGEAKAGIVICYESAFGDLSRQFVLRGADILIEMTNDGYLGQTPVLRQHLANSVFRAVETHRPLLRTTNVGIGGYITDQGEILDATKSYTEDTRVWPVTKSDGRLTFYVKYGDWFAYLCSLVTLGALMIAIARSLRH